MREISLSESWLFYFKKFSYYSEDLLVLLIINMKTIFITSFHPLISRNILLPLLPYLAKKKDLQVTLFVPQKKWKYFYGVFSKENVILESIRQELSLAERFLRYFSLATLDTETLKIKRKTEMRGSGAMLSYFIAGRKLNQGLIRVLSSLLTPHRKLETFFNNHKPSLVFSTDIQNEYDIRMLHLARRRGIRTIAMIRSLDNTTSKGLLRFIPDFFLVQNEIIKQELEKLHGVPAEKISIIGIPHYDFYSKPIEMSRKNFFNGIKSDASKKTILFAPIGDRYIEKNTL